MPKLRRPGYLADWASFGEEFFQTKTTSEQTSEAQAKYAEMRRVAAQSGRRTITSSTPVAAFAIRSGEDREDRFKRLAAAGLFTPGGIMSTDYANLVYYGTADQSKINKFKAQAKQWQDKENVRRYGTTNINKIVSIVNQKRSKREAVWQRVYGTSNPDVIYKLDPQKREKLCQADAECRALANLFNGLGNFGPYTNFLVNTRVRYR